MDFLNMSKEELLALFYIAGNVVCLFILGLLYLKNRNNKETKSQYFNYIVISLALYFIGDALWSPCYFKLFPNSDILIKFARMTYYTASAFLGYLWFVYIEIILGSSLVYNKKKRRLLHIPIAVAAIYAIIICLFFDPSIKNIFGYLTAFSLVIEPFLFVIIAGIRVLIKQTKLKNNILRKRYLNMALWPIVILLVSVIQLFFAEIPVFCFGATIIVLALYIYNQDSLISTDPLTGIYNRNMLNNYISNGMDNNYTYYILMIDIDRFKSINDTYGHLEGDKALKYMAKLISNVANKNGDFYARYGGDEFIIISKEENEENIINLIKSINLELTKTKEDLGYAFTTSIGYAIYNKDKTIEETIEIADQNLYKAKEVAHEKGLR